MLKLCPISGITTVQALMIVPRVAPSKFRTVRKLFQSSPEPLEGLIHHFSSENEINGKFGELGIMLSRV